MAHLLFTFTHSTQTYISVGSNPYMYACIQIAAGASVCTGAPHTLAKRDAGEHYPLQRVALPHSEPVYPVCVDRGVSPLQSPVPLIWISSQADSCDVWLLSC